MESGDSYNEDEISLTNKDGVDLQFDRRRLSANFPKLQLNTDNPESSRITVTLEKMPIKLEEGKCYGLDDVLVDQENEKMRYLAEEAGKLKSLPIIERPRKVLELLRSHMHYAYNDLVEILEKQNPELAQWVIKNTSLESKGGNKVPLSELIDSGYGICRHLAPAYLWLAQKAGLEGIIQRSGAVIVNIQRSDTGKKLFKSAEIGGELPFHVWVEIKAGNKWIPVDPSVQLVGDNEEGMEMFRRANYIAGSADNISSSVDPNILKAYNGPLLIKPGESQIKVDFWVRSGGRPTPKPPQGYIPKPIIPYSGAAKMFAETYPSSDMDLEIADVE